jgi:hypothetical protein
VEQALADTRGVEILVGQTAAEEEQLRRGYRERHPEQNIPNRKSLHSDPPSKESRFEFLVFPRI